MKSPELTNQPVGRPAFSQQTGHCEDDVIIDCNFDQWDTFNDVTHQNIARNRTGVVAEMLCGAGSMCGEWLVYSTYCIAV